MARKWPADDVGLRPAVGELAGVTCDGALGDDLTYANPRCSWSVQQRGWGFVNAIAQRSGVLQSVINDYKYEGRRGWAWIFARLLVGYLGENFAPGDDQGVIVAAPTYVGPGGRTWDHIGLVLEREAIEDRCWPFAPGAIVKTGPSAKMMEMDWRQRAHASTYELPRLLEVPDASVVAGKRVLVYDEVFTSGNTLRAVARTLFGGRRGQRRRGRSDTPALSGRTCARPRRGA